MRSAHLGCSSDGEASTAYTTADEITLSDSLSGRSVDDATPPISPFTEECISKRSRRSFESVLAWSNSSQGLAKTKQKHRMQHHHQNLNILPVPEPKDVLGQGSDVADLPQIKVSYPSRVSPNGWLAGVQEKSKAGRAEEVGESPTNSSIPSLDTLELVLEDPERFATAKFQLGSSSDVSWGETGASGGKCGSTSDRKIKALGKKDIHYGEEDTARARTEVQLEDVASTSVEETDSGYSSEEEGERGRRGFRRQALSYSDKQSPRIPIVSPPRRLTQHIPNGHDPSANRTLLKLTRLRENHRVQALVETINEPLDEMDQLEKAAGPLKNEIRTRLDQRRSVQDRSELNQIVDFADWASASASASTAAGGSKHAMKDEQSLALVKQLQELEEGFEEIGKDNEILSTALKVVSERLEQADKLKAQLIQQNTQLCASLQEANNSNEQLLKQHGKVTKELAKLKLKLKRQASARDGQLTKVQNAGTMYQYDDNEVVDKNEWLRELNQSNSDQVKAARDKLDREKKQLQDVKDRLRKERTIRFEAEKNSEEVVEEQKEDTSIVTDTCLNTTRMMYTNTVNGLTKAEQEGDELERVKRGSGVGRWGGGRSTSKVVEEVDEELVWIQKSFGEYQETS